MNQLGSIDLILLLLVLVLLISCDQGFVGLPSWPNEFLKQTTKKRKSAPEYISQFFFFICNLQFTSAF